MTIAQFPGRLLQLAAASWRERRRRGEMKRYSVRPREDRRNLLARRVDFYCTLLLLWFIVFVFLAAAGTGWTALPLSLALTALAGWGADKLQRSRRQREGRYRKLRAAAARFREKLQKAAGKEELAALVLPLLNEQSHLQDATEAGDKNSGFVCTRARYQGVPVTVHYLPFTETPVAVGGVMSLLEEMKKQKSKNAIFVAAGEFTPAAVRLVKSRQSRCRIALLDENQLLALAGKSGRLEGDGEVGEAKAEAENKTMFGQFFFQPQKARVYLFAGVLLLGFDRWLAPPAVCARLYPVFAAVNLVLALLCLVRGRGETPPGLDDWHPQT